MSRNAVEDGAVELPKKITFRFCREWCVCPLDLMVNAC